jgi:hypothetical protein
VKVEAVPVCNRLYITVDQAFTPTNFQGLIEEIQREALQLKPGWTAALDLRGLWVADPFFSERVALLQTTILERGAKKIGTLLDNSSIQMYLGQAGLKTNANEITQRFFTQENWEKFLEETVSNPDL